MVLGDVQEKPAPLSPGIIYDPKNGNVIEEITRLLQHNRLFNMPRGRGAASKFQSQTGNLERFCTRALSVPRKAPGAITANNGGSFTLSQDLC